jgi:hypothetical protein
MFKFTKKNGMYSKEEKQLLKREFWTIFGSSYPRKWMLYDTQIKDVSFKFYVDNRIARVQLDIEPRDAEKRKIYYEKIESLRTLLREEHLPNALFERHLTLENGKTISRIWVELEGVNMNRRDDWDRIHHFFATQMHAFEEFFIEYEDYIRDLDLNT